MKRIIQHALCGITTISCLMLSLQSLGDSNTAEQTNSSHTYGAAITLQEAISMAEAIALADSQRHEPLLVKAQVGSLCEKKGCWLSLEDDTRQVRVTFKNYGFFVPPTIKGQTVLVEGTIQKTTLSLAESKHYVQDAGGDPTQVTQPISEYQMIATGVETH